MPLSLATATLVISGLFFVFTTWTSATAPAAFAKQLGLTLADAGGTNEIRSQYAGFFLAAAIACALAIFGLIPDREALVVLAVIFGGCGPHEGPHREFGGQRPKASKGGK